MLGNAIKIVLILCTGAMDSFARGLKKASQIISEGILTKNVKVGSWSMLYVVSKCGVVSNCLDDS